MTARRRPGPRRRFKDSKSVSFSLDLPTRRALDKLARLECCAKSDVLRRAIGERLARLAGTVAPSKVVAVEAES